MVRELFRSSARTSEGPDGRHWEIDALRGLAIVMMVVYHLMYDLYYFKVSDAIFTSRFWFYFQRTTASLFIILMGISLTLNYSRSLQQGREVRYRTFLQRGGRLFAWGLVISDLRLPGIDGQHLLRTVAEVQPAARRILITGFGTTETEAWACSEADDYLIKPFSTQRLLQTVHRLLPDTTREKPDV